MRTRFLLILLLLVACKKKAATEGAGATATDDARPPAIPAVADTTDAAAPADPCLAVTEHMLSIEEKEMAPATFANRGERLTMLRGECAKHGLAPGEAECLLAATSQTALNACRPKP
jgi:hypothetical protein